MKAQFTHLTGSRAGQTDIFGQAYVTAGRHPQCELRFDADKDLDVSSRHAAILREGEIYVLRDLGSTNGTFVQGKKLAGDHVLVSRDVIRFGANGPQVEFTAISAPRTSPPPQVAPVAPVGTVVFGQANEPAPAPPPALTPEQLRSPRRTPGPGTQTRVRVAVRKETRSLRNTAIGLFVLLVLLAGAYLYQAWNTGKALAMQRADMLATVDSLLGEIDALSSGSQELRSALDSAQVETTSLRQQLASAPNEGAIEELRQRLDAAIKQQRSLVGVSQLDASAIAQGNRPAVAMVFVQFPNEKVYTGTAFAVSSDANGGLLITNKHVVVDSASGGLASRIGIVFEGSRQVFKADIVRLSEDADLALLTVSVHKGFPVIKGLADSARFARVGEPTAVIGFPLGVDVARGHDWSQIGVASTLTVGRVSRVLPDLLQLDSYGAQGSSGSPILDRRGDVIGVLYGGQAGTNGRILYGVPVRYVHQLLGGQ